MSERVTVIIPYFNQGQYLERAVLSALAAYRGPLEILIVDDGSTERGVDSYLRRAKSLSDSVEIIRKTNGGLSSARNAGLDQATGKYIQFLDCDDLLVSGKIDDQVNHIKASGIDVSVCNYVSCDNFQEKIMIESYDVIGSFSLSVESFLRHWERGFIIPIHSGLFLRSSIDERRFDERVYGKEDWIFWCQLVGHGARLSYLPTVGAIYRQHSGGMTKAKMDRMGQSWLVAANKIAASVPGADSGFLETARHWYISCYAAQIPRQDDARVPTARPSETTQDTAQHIDKIKAAKESFASKDIDDYPKFSLIVPLFNHFDFFIECLCSLFRQTVGDFEIIVVDDKSSDSRINVLLENIDGLAADLKIIRNAANSGISLSQNRAADVARGEFLVFVDCDDMLAENAIEQIQAVLKEHTGIDYLFTDRLDIDEDGRRIREAKYGGYPTILPGGSIREDLLDGMVASHLKVIRKSVYEAVGGCDANFDGAQDWDLALKILVRGGKFHYFSAPVYLHRIHQRSVTMSDSPRQFRLTNVIRRNYSTKLLGSKEPIFEESDLSIESIEERIKLTRRNILLMPLSQLPTLGGELRRICTGHDGCILYEDVKASPFQLAFLREWNSYFDLMLLDNFETYVALMGYLWDQRICRFRHDFSVEFLEALERWPRYSLGQATLKPAETVLMG